MDDVHSERKLTERIANLLREEIARAKSGDRLASIRGLARRFSVSTVTVGEALAALAQEGLIQKRHGSGTYVLGRKTPQHVAIVSSIHPLDPHTRFHTTRTIEKLIDFFADHGVHAHTYWAPSLPEEAASDPALREFADNLRLGRTQGVVLTKRPHHARWREAVRNCGVPVVGDETPYRVEGDPLEVTREGARYLVATGRRKLAFLAGGDPSVGAACQAGWCRRLRDTFGGVLAQHGVVAREEWMRGDFLVVEPGAGYSQFKEIWTAAADKPDGLLVTDDYLFNDVCAAILEMGIRVPEQLLTVTLANKDSDMLYPFPTARMEYDPELFAEHLGQMLWQLMRGERVLEPNPSVSFQWVGVDPQWLEQEATKLARSPGLVTKQTQ